MEKNEIIIENNDIVLSDVQESELDMTPFETSDSILNYGHEIAEGVSAFSTEILTTLNKTTDADAGKVLLQINKIMEEFEIEDFREVQGGFLEKLFNSASKKLDKMLAKYDNFNADIDVIFKEIKKYEFDIKDSNNLLETMFEENKKHFNDLDVVIAKGNKALTIMRDKSMTLNEMDRIEITDHIELLEQRIYDLELAKAVSLQTAPQLKLLKKTNTNLLRKINSSFVITLPIFRQSIIQAITVKRQMIQAKALKSLDDATNELLIQNSKNTVDAAKKTAQLSGQPTIKLETLQESYSTIIEGIKEVQALEVENSNARKEGLAALADLQEHIISGKSLETQVEVIEEK